MKEYGVLLFATTASGKLNSLLIPTGVRTQRGREKGLGKVCSRRLMMELATSQQAFNN